MAVSRRIVPVVGGVTAAATAVGAFAPAAHIASAAPEAVDSTAGAGGLLGLAQEGVFDSCSAYFGFGKEDGAINATAFEVTDVEGEHGATHTVPEDVDVVLVIEFTDGQILECVPEEITEEDWNLFLEDSWFFGRLRPWPGPGHYAYPSVAFDEEDSSEVDAAAIEGYGPVAAVGFRVVGVPAEHSLISPEGVRALPDQFAGALDTDIDFDDDVLDPFVLEVAEAGAGAAAAAALAAAFEACINEQPYDESDPDLIAGAEAVIAYIEGDDVEVDEVSCFTIAAIEDVMEFVGAVEAAATHVEGITLAGPAAPVPAPPAPPAPAAQPAVAAPTFTG